jgi:hypothetical protein
MIVRIMADKQYRIDDERTVEIREIGRLDDDLTAALEDGAEDRFCRALTGLVDLVRRCGQVLPDDELVPSDLIVPAIDMTLPETRSMLQVVAGHE